MVTCIYSSASANSFWSKIYQKWLPLPGDLFWTLNGRSFHAIEAEYSIPLVDFRHNNYLSILPVLFPSNVIHSSRIYSIDEPILYSLSTRQRWKQRISSWNYCSCFSHSIDSVQLFIEISIIISIIFLNSFFTRWRSTLKIPLPIEEVTNFSFY